MRQLYDDRKRRQEENTVKQTCTFKPSIRSPLRSSRRNKETLPLNVPNGAQKNPHRLKTANKSEKEGTLPARSKSRGVPQRDDPLKTRLLRDRNERPLPARDSGRKSHLPTRSPNSNLESLRNSLERASLPSNLLFFEKKSPSLTPAEQRAPSRSRERETAPQPPYRDLYKRVID